MATRPDPQQDTIRLNPRRVYKCDKENRTMSRADVWKDAFGNFHCTSCSSQVRDITNTETGQDLMEMVGI